MNDIWIFAAGMSAGAFFTLLGMVAIMVYRQPVVKDTEVEWEPPHIDKRV